MNLLLITLAVFFLNIPFGYWRANVKKLSIQWFLAIHLPVPFIVMLRFYGEIGFELYTYPILIGAFFIGQRLGAIINTKWKKTGNISVSSCLFADIYKRCSSC